jgi:hypothetical protein
MTIPVAALLGSGGGGGGSGVVETIVPGSGIAVDATDPANPIVSVASGVGTLKVRLAASTNTGRTGLAAIDGVTPVAGNRILCLAETAPANNGIYVAAAGAWSRATDFDAAGEMIPGVLVSVTEGTVYTDSLWMFATTGVIVVGTTALAFAFIGPSFGPDTRVLLPNSALVKTQALRLQTTFTDNTAGAETSQTEFSEKVAGADTVGFTVRGNQLLLPAQLLFAASLTDFIFHAGAGNYGIWCGGNNVLAFTVAGITMNGGIGSDYLWGANGAGAKYTSASGQVALEPDTAQGNV